MLPSDLEITITNQQLTAYLNYAFGSDLVFESITVKEYTKQRQAELGDFLGTVIGGIYSGIRKGDFDVASDDELAAGRAHVEWDDYFKSLRSID